jgi:hypothetical protein
LCPSAGCAEAIVDDGAQSSGSIGILTLLNEQFKGRNNDPDFSEKFVEAKSVDQGLSPIERLLSCDFGHGVSCALE